METGLKNILILGGSKFVGRNLVERISVKYNLTLANRGSVPELSNIQVDRDNGESCSALSGVEYDCVVDLSGYNLNQFKNTYQFINTKRYVFISSTAVNSYPFNNVAPEDYALAQYAYEKFECEEFIKQNIKEYSIIRPCYIVGKYDDTNRFIFENGIWKWKRWDKPLYHYVTVDRVCEIIEQQIESNYIGIIQSCD